MSFLLIYYILTYPLPAIGLAVCHGMTGCVIVPSTSSLGCIRGSMCQCTSSAFTHSQAHGQSEKCRNHYRFAHQNPPSRDDLRSLHLCVK